MQLLNKTNINQFNKQKKCLLNSKILFGIIIFIILMIIIGINNNKDMKNAFDQGKQKGLEKLKSE